MGDEFILFNLTRGLNRREHLKARLTYLDSVRIMTTGVCQPFRAWVAAVNARDWIQANSYLHGTIILGQTNVDAENFTSYLKKALSSCPDDEWQIDILIAGPDTVGTRIIHNGTLTGPYLGGSVTGKPTQWAEHMLAWFTGGKISRIFSLIDAKPLTSLEEAVPLQTPDLNPSPASPDLDAEALYHKYINSINTGTMREVFPSVYHPRLTHNGKSKARDDVWKFVEETSSPHSRLRVGDLLVDQSRKGIAAILEFMVGDQVWCEEIAFYMLDGDLVIWIWAVLDIERFTEFQAELLRLKDQ